MRTDVRWAAIAAVCLVLGSCVAWSRWSHSTNGRWSEKDAAAYLDGREATWSKWPTAARGQGTFCVSCHTTLPYALSREALSAALNEKVPSPEEQGLVADVKERVELWPKSSPYYRDLADESRGTESVLNALILATYDSRTGKLSPDTKQAFDEMWSTQKKTGSEKGAWSWLDFDSQPWEAGDSTYYGASLAAVAVGVAPENYLHDPEIQENLALLRDYLQHAEESQIPINRVALLWASTKLPGLLDRPEQDAIIEEVLSKQRADGGWCLAALVGSWKREDNTPLIMKSDGYATGFITYVLEESGYPQGDTHIKKALDWLVANQTWWGGHWDSYSLNKRRHDPFSNVSQFMNDAATAYAVLALTRAGGGAKAAATAKTSEISSASMHLTSPLPARKGDVASKTAGKTL